MDDLAPKPSKVGDEHKLKINPHFEVLKGKMRSEALEILASIVAEYLTDEDDDN